MRKLKFLKNAFILTITAFLLKFLGMLLRIFMSNTIGAEGIGLYQLTLSIYVMASTFATAGVSTAVIRIITDELISGNKLSVNRALKKSLIISFGLGIISTIIVFIFAEPIGKYLLNDTRTIPALKILVCAFPFMSITSCLKGYFMATKNVTTPSNAQLFEQVIRLVLIYFLLNKFAYLGLTSCCFIIMLSDVIAESSSCIYSFIRYYQIRNNITATNLISKKKKRIITKFFSISLPVAGTRYVNSFLHTIENILVPSKLRLYNNSQEKALAQFGMIKGMAIPVLFFPSSVLNAISALLLPEMSEANELNQKNKIESLVKKTLHFTIVSSILIGGIFYTFAYELSEVIYKNTEVGHIIKMLAPLVPFMYLESVITGLLQGLNQQFHSLKYIIMDSIIRIILVLLIVGSYGLDGFLYIMIISNISTSCLNLRRLLKVTNIQIDWKNWIITPLIWLTISNCALLKVVSYYNLSTIPYLLIGISIVSIIYVIGILLTNKALIRHIQ